jgi:glutamate racemase
LKDNRPIGVFDSGVGGLTVLHALRQALPHEDFVYLGDTARVPYGPKSATLVQRFALEAVQYLLTHDIKLMQNFQNFLLLVW